jgi:hypothetical protein
MALVTKKAALAAAVVSLVALGACGQSEKFDRAAYTVCLADAKKAGSNLANATFAKFEDSKVASSTGDDQFRVNIPYELNGQKGLFQCIADKNRDGSFSVAKD